jgi:tryptophan halogenase
MDMKVNSITIVGGGTSGWLAASYLFKNQPDIKITVVDKEIGTPVGVGEATLLSFKPFMDECGIPIEEWIIPLDAGYKSGILFTNWRKDGDNIWHPFYKGNRPVEGVIKTHDLWSRHQHLDFKEYALDFYTSSVVHNTVDISNIDSYASHVDCGKLVVFLQDRLKNKINIIKSDVVNVVKNEQGIDYLELKDGTVIKSDLYVDCTGFKNVLRTPEKRINLEDRLFVNTALAHPVQYQDKSTEFKPYAVCEAVEHGWMWKIGVASRIGTGLVFNRNITSIEDAKDSFVEHWDHRIKKENIRVIDWTPFYIEDQWSGNVVNIGLSAGFIEPLESTGIALITIGITQLNNALNERYYINENQEFYNLQMKILYEDCVDFVSMHYANNNRPGMFWDYVRKTFKQSNRMLHYMEELANPDITIPRNAKYNYMFGGANWFLMMYQLGFYVAPRNMPIPDALSLEKIIAIYIEHVKNRHIWSRHHSSEIDRLHELNKI